MPAFFGQLDYVEPRYYYNARSILLVFWLTFMTGLIWPRSPLSQKEQKELLLVYPVIVIVYWLLFQVLRLSLIPGGHYSAEPIGFYAWWTNTFISLGFGAIFSAGILLRLPGIRRRLYGGFWLTAYLVLIFFYARSLLNLGQMVGHYPE